MKPEDINPLALLAERKIKEAMEQGQFDNLPGRGRPQKLEDLSQLPEDLRLAYIILSNSGYMEGQSIELPPSSLREMLDRSTGEAQGSGQMERLNCLLNRARRDGTAPKGDLENENLPAALNNPEYLERVLKKM